MIWLDKTMSIKKLRPLGQDTMGHHLAIELIDMGDDFLKARMPVDNRTIQPYGFLHGGASCALAETVGSVASYLVIDHNLFYCVGLEINANHLRTATEGFVFATAIPLHLGRSTHVWDIKITDENDRLICASRLTVAIVPRKETMNKAGL
jgi:1,4-dihydroxy-2-naphthoyl-CoA hydrolase